MIRRLEVAFAAAVIAAVAGGFVAVSSGWPGAAVAGAVLVARLLGERFVRRRVRAWAYCEREDDLLVRRGVLFSRLSVIPYGRV